MKSLNQRRITIYKIVFVFASFLMINFCVFASTKVQKEELCNDVVTEAPPVEVNVKIEIIDIRNIDSISHTFDADFYLMLDWSVEASKHLNTDESYNGEWRPIPEFINAVSINNITPKNFSSIDNMGERRRYDARYSGTFVSPMNFKSFPFDSQKLSILLEDYDQNTDNMRFVARKGSLSLKRTFSSLVDWTVLPKQSLLTERTVAHQIYPCESYSRIDSSITIERKSEYYDYKIVSICILITLFSWIAFALSPQCLAERTGITVTAFLALVAHNYVSMDALPKIPYLTALDTVLLGTQLLVFLSAIQHLIVYRVQQQSEDAKNIKRGKRIDLASVLFFALILIWILFSYQNGYSIGSNGE